MKGSSRASVKHYENYIARLPFEIQVYPDQDHGFVLGETFGAAAQDAWERAVAFLNKYLAGKQVVIPR
jgi:hypothetical protein